MIRATVCKATLPLAAAVLLQACAASGDYPSLARRDVERIEGTGMPAAGASEAPPARPPASADLTTRLEGLVAAARKAHTGFEAKRGTTERAVSGAGAVTTDSWTAAQVALADLQSSRSTAVTALAELDQLYVDERAAHPEQVSPAAAAIATARDQVQAWVASEDAAVEKLGSRLRG